MCQLAIIGKRVVHDSEQVPPSAMRAYVVRPQASPAVRLLDEVVRCVLEEEERHLQRLVHLTRLPTVAEPRCSWDRSSISDNDLAPPQRSPRELKKVAQASR